MTVSEQLLIVQDHDTRIDQLHHRQATMAERVALEAAEAELAATRAALATLDEQLTALAKEQRRLEGEVAVVEAKHAEVNGQLYGGAVSNPRELQALQDEIDALKRRQSHLEDQVIEVMEQREPLEAEQVVLVTREAAQAEAVQSAASLLTVAEAEVGVELDAELAARAEAVTGVSPVALAEYEQLRTQRGGIGVARLNGSTCDGCHLTLSAAEVSRIRKTAPDELVHCDECGRLLVH